MSFPNIDKFLVRKFQERVTEAKLDLGFLVEDTFGDMSQAERTEIGIYLARKEFTTDLRRREDNQVFIMPNYPLLDMPFPQIGVSLGQESPADRFMGDIVGESKPIMTNNVQTGWAIPKGYIGSCLYRTDIVCATKDETIWLSRLVQRFIFEEQENLQEIGAMEIDVTVADTRPDQMQLPMTVFSRAVQINCKVENTWTVNIPLKTVEIGNNTALPIT